LLSPLCFAFTSTAWALEFYLVREAATGKCDIVKEKPDGTDWVMMGTETYATMDEAKAAKKAAKGSGQCKKASG